MFIAMAIAAELMRQVLFEIAARMAFFTGHAGVPSAQREIGQIMVERAAPNAFPTLGRMACRAAVAKTALVRVLMARNAISKR